MMSLTKCILCDGWWEGANGKHRCSGITHLLTERRVREIVKEAIDAATLDRALSELTEKDRVEREAILGGLVPLVLSRRTGRDASGDGELGGGIVWIDKRVAQCIETLKAENEALLATRGTSRPFADDIAKQARDAAIEECAVRIDERAKTLGEAQLKAEAHGSRGHGVIYNLKYECVELARELRRMKGAK